MKDMIETGYYEMGGSAGRVRKASVTETLMARKQQLEEELGKVNAALNALEKNPELENILNLVSKAL